MSFSILLILKKRKMTACNVLLCKGLQQSETSPYFLLRVFFEEAAGVGRFDFYNFFGRALGYDSAAQVAAFGAEVNNVVCLLNDVQIVFYD